LRGDILKYLVGNSNGTYHYSADLRAIIHDVIGIPVNSTQSELSETVASLLDILHTDPEKRFLVSGEGDNIHIKRCFVRGDEDEISDLVEEWRYVYEYICVCTHINIYIDIYVYMHLEIYI
jgi:hypothetical protein